MSRPDRPAPAVIDDLERPRFPDEVQPMLAMLDEAGRAIELDPGRMMDDARAQTGLDDFGDDDFEERLSVLCQAFVEEADMVPRGMVNQSGLIGGLLKNRLLLEDLYARHPEIDEIEIVRPIVICGLPRTGTTHLHNLLAADPALRSLPYWESLEPVPTPGEDDPGARRERCGQAAWFINAMMPLFIRMHEMTVDHVHEEIQLLAIDFSTMLFETAAPMPSWRDAYLGRSQASSYAYLKRILKALTWLRGGERWVLKSPQHLEQFPVLLQTFPDATFVVTHRDPVSVAASMATMVAYSARMVRDEVDAHAIGRYWAARFEQMLGAAAAERDVLPADRSIDVHFDEFMADDMAMVERIYRLAGQPMTDAARASMDAFMAEHPRGRFGTVEYDLGRLGLDQADLRSALRFYSDRFGVADEGE